MIPDADIFLSRDAYVLLMTIYFTQDLCSREQFHFSTSNTVNAMHILLLIERSLLLSSKLSFVVLNILFLLRRADTQLSLIDEQFYFSTSNRVNAMHILLLIERSLLLSSKLSFGVLNILFLLRRADTTLKAGIDWHCDRVSHGLMDYFPYTPR